MGNMKDLMGMIPGVSKLSKDIDIDDEAFNGVEVIIKSMTPKERSQPQIMNHNRKIRIAKNPSFILKSISLGVSKLETISCFIQ